MSQVVTFVAARLVLTEQQIEKLTAPPTSSRLMLSSGTKAQELLAAAPATAKKLQDILAIVAQQFAGYMFNLRVAEVSHKHQTPVPECCMLAHKFVSGALYSYWTKCGKQVFADLSSALALDKLEYMDSLVFNFVRKHVCWSVVRLAYPW